MKTIDYWNDFLKTGSIDAYLRCVSSEQAAGMEQETKDSDWTGDNPYAGFSNHNGNSNEDSTYRGI